MPRLRYETTVEAPIDEVFAWHERSGAVQRLLPPWEPIRVTSTESTRSAAAAPPDGKIPSPLAVGSCVEFELAVPGHLLELGLKKLGLPRWVAEHTYYDPPHEFRDTTRKGPFRSWKHRHRFEATAGGTTVIDEVDFQLPLGRLGALAADTSQTRLTRMFAYRHRQLADDLAAHARAAARGAGKLRVVIAGSSGLIGSALSAFLRTGGHDVLTLVRRPARTAEEVYWNPEYGVLDPTALIGVDAVINLAGAPLLGRWSKNHKLAVLTSRIYSTTLLSQTLAALAAENAGGPTVLINGSAIGYYGPDAGSRLLTEDSAAGVGFLAEVVQEWEKATEAAQAAGLRVVHVRTGVVQSPSGGALRAQLPLFLAGAGGRLGSGEQWLSWIGLDDIVGVFHHALTTPTLHGAINAVAPEPVTTGEYAATLARVLGRPALLPIPAFGLTLVLGSQAAHEMLLTSQRVVPQRALESDYIFRNTTLDSALRHVLGRS